MNLEFVRQLRFVPIVQRYDARDSALYALSLGMGEDPLDEDELPFVYEGHGLRVVPSQCVTLCWPPFWHKEPAAQISWRRILHGEQNFTLNRPLPVEAAMRGHHAIVAVEDKGPSRGALVYTTQELTDADSGEPLASLRSAEFLRDDGGCGGFGAPPNSDAAAGNDRRTDGVVEYRTSRQAALLYRQASRDYMPIHADPDIARDAGFERPISHGLNTFGLVCRAALKHFAPGRPETLKSMSVRFAAPAYPGDTICIELFATTQGALFRARVLERKVLVLDRGEIELW